MRWNPVISSYKLEVYHRNCEDFPDGFRMDWSVWDYQEAYLKRRRAEALVEVGQAGAESGTDR